MKTDGINFSEAMRIMKSRDDFSSVYPEVMHFIQSLEKESGCEMVLLPNSSNQDYRFDFKCGLTALYLAGYRRGIQDEREKQHTKRQSAEGSSRIRQARERKGISIDDLSRITGIRKKHIMQYERGTSRPRDEAKYLIAEALDESVADLFFKEC